MQIHRNLSLNKSTLHAQGSSYLLYQVSAKNQIIESGSAMIRDT